MATLQTDIIGKVLFFYELPQIEISHFETSPLRVVISTDDRGTLLDETYWPDFNQKIFIDIKDLVANELSHDIPGTDQFALSSSIFKVFHISIGDNLISGDFTVNGFSSEAASKISDIDTLRIPENYRLPLSLFNNAKSYSIEYLFSDGSSINDGNVTAQESGVGMVARMIDLEQSPAVGKKKFQIRASATDKMLHSPVFEISGGKFEQYLFANRYGGFDNIAMEGALEFAPNMSFESGSYSSRNEQISAESEYIYTQNSGYLSQRVMELMSELLCCSQIYHLDENGNFRRIVILDSDLHSKSNEQLHSFSFRYKYMDDVRPLSLKGKTMAESRSVAGEPMKTLMYKLTESPMAIRHNKNRYPCVTVIDDHNQVVTVSVEYIDDNNIKIIWNGALSGYVYVN